jgi:hypothetical protein
LNLQGNALTGPLPLALTHLTCLTELNLAKNQLTGGVPSAWGDGWHQSLGTLNLNQNQLCGICARVKKERGRIPLESISSHTRGHKGLAT